jgi:hypothetical protein
MSNDIKRLSIDDDRVRAMRDYLQGAQTSLTKARAYTMWPEVRTELNDVLTQLNAALTYIGK